VPRASLARIIMCVSSV